MNRFVLKMYFHENIHISLSNKYFYKNKKSKLCFEDRVAVPNDFFLPIWRSIYRSLLSDEPTVSRHPPLNTDGAPAPEEEVGVGRPKSRRPNKENSRYIGSEWMA
jgi:hypothetical protein